MPEDNGRYGAAKTTQRLDASRVQPLPQQSSTPVHQKCDVCGDYRVAITEHTTAISEMRETFKAVRADLADLIKVAEAMKLIKAMAAAAIVILVGSVSGIAIYACDQKERDGSLRGDVVHLREQQIEDRREQSKLREEQARQERERLQQDSETAQVLTRIETNQTRLLEQLAPPQGKRGR